MLCSGQFNLLRMAVGAFISFVQTLGNNARLNKAKKVVYFLLPLKLYKFLWVPLKRYGKISDPAYYAVCKDNCLSLKVRSEKISLAFWNGFHFTFEFIAGRNLKDFFGMINTDLRNCSNLFCAGAIASFFSISFSASNFSTPSLILVVEGILSCYFLLFLLFVTFYITQNC